jgi:hypothetical protein
VIDPAALQMVLGVLTGWLDRREREAVAYLIEENRLLRRQLGKQRLRFSDDDRRRLAARWIPMPVVVDLIPAKAASSGRSSVHPTSRAFSSALIKLNRHASVVFQRDAEAAIRARSESVGLVDELSRLGGQNGVGPDGPVMAQIQALVVRRATENRTWGYTRLQGRSPICTIVWHRHSLGS